MAGNEPENTAGAAQGSSSPRADEPKICGNCGDQIEIKKWHPVVTRTDEDGSFTVFAFCDEDCWDEWEETNPNNTTRR